MLQVEYIDKDVIEDALLAEDEFDPANLKAKANMQYLQSRKQPNTYIFLIKHRHTSLFTKEQSQLLNDLLNAHRAQVPAHLRFAIVITCRCHRVTMARVCMVINIIRHSLRTVHGN